MGGCLIAGQILGVLTGTYDECGGTLTQNWTFIDDCGRTSTQTQTITVEPAPQAQFSAVTPVTISCDAAASFAASNLSYTNNGLGGCLIAGQILGVLTGTYDECGGTLTQNWTFIDDCGRTSTQTQTITVEPAPQAQFTNVSPISISCDVAASFAPSNLAYTNNGLGGGGRAAARRPEPGRTHGHVRRIGGTLTGRIDLLGKPAERAHKRKRSRWTRRSANLPAYRQSDCDAAARFAEATWPTQTTAWAAV